jgi:hypothetical protein
MATEQCHRTYKIMARAALGKYHGRLLLRSRMERPMDSNETDLCRRIVGGLSSVAMAAWDAGAATRTAQARGNDQVAVGGPREMSLGDTHQLLENAR